MNVPTVKLELDEWTFAHMVHHRDVNARIFKLVGIRLDEYVLDPVDPKDPGQWEYQHQAMHQLVNTILGVNGLDLSDVDFNNPGSLAGWIQSNFSEHIQWSNILGVG